jgi:outer membrane protein assembly factor BamB
VKKAFVLLILLLASLPLWARDIVAIDPNALVRSRYNTFELGGVAAGPGFAIAVSNRGWVVSVDDRGKIKWRVKTDCEPITGPVIDSEKVFFACGNGTLMSLGLADGKQAWKFKFQDSVVSRPAVSDQSVIFQTGTGKVFSLDKNSGGVQWIAKSPVRRGLSLRDAGQPLVVGSTIYLGMGDGTVAALALEDGRLLWKKKIFERPITSDIDFNLLYDKKYGFFAASREGIASISGNGGKVYWTIDESIVCNPVQDQESVFAVNSDNELLVIDKLLGTVEKRVQIKKPYFAKWEFERPIGIFLENQKIYAVITDALWQIDPEKATAKKVKGFANWVQKAELANGRLYAISSNGYLEILPIK